MNNKFFIAFMFFTLSFNSFGQNQYRDSIYSSKVKSVKFFLNSNQLSYPVYLLNSENYLQLTFDILQDEPQDLQYSFVHCSWDWQEEDLSENDFLDGFYVNDVTRYYQSFNTTVNYVNYSITIPNQNVKFLVSGNYLIKVFLASNPDSVILQKRFFVVEDNIIVNAQVKKATISQYRLNYQEVDFAIDISNLSVDNPWTYIKASVYQNFRFDRVKFFSQPKYFQGTVLNYNYDEENLFPGDNEYRTFNSSDFKHASGKIFSYQMDSSYYNCYLLPDNILHSYSSYNDADGNFVIYRRDAVNSMTEADYVYIHFKLLRPFPFDNGDVYVFGAFSNWKIRKENKLNYNFVQEAYEGKILLKQGIYDYHYIFVPNNGLPTTEPTEGNFYQTKNTYFIFIYYEEQSPYYDRIIGFKKLQ